MLRVLGSAAIPAAAEAPEANARPHRTARRRADPRALRLPAANAQEHPPPRRPSVDRLHDRRRTRFRRVRRDVVVSTDFETLCRHCPSLRRRGALPAPGHDIAAPPRPTSNGSIHALETLAAGGRRYEAFAILRPTSPFRKPETIRRAWQTFLAAERAWIRCAPSRRSSSTPERCGSCATTACCRSCR